MKNYVTFSDAVFKSVIAEEILENSLRFCCFLKFPGELGKFPEISPIFNGRPFPRVFHDVWEPWLTLAAAIAVVFVMSVVP